MNRTTKLLIVAASSIALMLIGGYFADSAKGDIAKTVIGVVTFIVSCGVALLISGYFTDKDNKRMNR